MRLSNVCWNAVSQKFQLSLAWSVCYSTSLLTGPAIGYYLMRKGKYTLYNKHNHKGYTISLVCFNLPTPITLHETINFLGLNLVCNLFVYYQITELLNTLPDWSKTYGVFSWSYLILGSFTILQKAHKLLTSDSQFRSFFFCSPKILHGVTYYEGKCIISQ